VKHVEARVDRDRKSTQPNSARRTSAEVDVRDLWLVRVQRLEDKLKNAERDLIAAGLDALGVRALAETIRNEIAALKALATDRVGWGSEQ
jgi:hypothetical protein